MLAGLLRDDPPIVREHLFHAGHGRCVGCMRSTSAEHYLAASIAVRRVARRRQAAGMAAELAAGMAAELTPVATVV